MSEYAPADRMLTAIKLAEQSTQGAKDAAVAAAGITKAQYNALLILSSHPALTGAELARRCFVTPQSMNETVNRLSRDGLVSREPHETHQHVTELRLTKAGQRALRAADKEVSSVERSVRELYSPAELELLRSLLDRLAHVDYMAT